MLYIMCPFFSLFSSVLLLLQGNESSATGPPTELFGDELEDDDAEKDKAGADVSKGGLKFGWITGVLVGFLFNLHDSNISSHAPVAGNVPPLAVLGQDSMSKLMFCITCACS